ncbi:hypothetical protein PLICRDRAFT_108255, partial [Plicaturopsis crispa FD-325 SS-3]
IGDYYRGCNHYVFAYYTGEKRDCGREDCRESRSHAHIGRNCTCPNRGRDDRQVRNMFQPPCEECRAAEFRRLSGR